MGTLAKMKSWLATRYMSLRCFIGTRNLPFETKSRFIILQVLLILSVMIGHLFFGAWWFNTTLSDFTSYLVITITASFVVGIINALIAVKTYF